jgi:hypothetical protein
MIRRLLLLALAATATATTWDHDFAVKTIWFSSAAYCDRGE